MCIYNTYIHTHIDTQGLAEVMPLSVVGWYVTVSHEMDSSLNISPKMSYGVLECEFAVL